MCEKRIKLHSTIEELFDNIDYSPKAPLIRPLKEAPIIIPELQLTYETPSTQKLLPISIIIDEERFEQLPIPMLAKHIKKRQRFQSENVHYTVINMMERQLQRRKASRPAEEEFEF